MIPSEKPKASLWRLALIISAVLAICLAFWAYFEHSRHVKPRSSVQISAESTTSASMSENSGVSGDLSNTGTENSSSLAVSSQYPLHKNITATVFWVGEPVGNGSSEDNAVSAWDDDWKKDFGGYDDYVNRNGYFPAGFTPKENPFYLDLPYNDFDDNGNRRADAGMVVPWARGKIWSPDKSMMKNRWVKITKAGAVCYGQIEDAGPYVYDDASYVFGTSQPKSTEANNAGMDVSPAIRDCLKFNGVNNDENKVDWQFVDEKKVPAGPWKQVVTSSQINWH